ncbi:MAG: phosphoribosylglycinamide formyltransferase [Neisseriaceae bacterium]|nr:MAG: phosphoribosylglycinamide formyltransferase [Neisseriaceae bacterium]
MNKKIVILISGNGSNMKAIVNANIKNATIVAVISNNENAPGISWAEQQGLNAISLNHQSFVSREAYDSTLIKLIDQFEPDLVVLAGFMRILSESFCEHYKNRLMNIHPSLLPAFPGLNTHKNAIESGCKIAGCTVHFVTPKLDSGPIIAQAAVPITSGDTAETLAKKVLSCEHIIYPMAIQDFIFNNLLIKENKVINQRQHDEHQQKILNF